MKPVEFIRRFYAGQRNLPASSLNAMREAIRAFWNNVTVSPPLVLQRAGGGVHLGCSRGTPLRFGTCEFTSETGSGVYQAKEKIWDADGLTWIDKTGGWTGDVHVHGGFEEMALVIYFYWEEEDDEGNTLRWTSYYFGTNPA